MSRGPYRHAPTGEPRRLVDGGAENERERAIAELLAKVRAPHTNDVAVARLWRQMSVPAERRTRISPYVWGPAVALGMLLVAMLTASVRQGVPTRVSLASASGGVFSTQRAERWHAGKPGEAFDEASRLRTDSTGRALVSLHGVSAVLLGENSDVGFERLSHGTFLRLSSGVLTARVSKRAPDEPFVVQTDRYAVKVVGTLFTVEQGPGDQTAVSVREGIVEVSDTAGHVERVTAGTRWTSDAGSARGTDHTPDAVKRLLEDTLHEDPGAMLEDALATPAQPTALPRVSKAPDVTGKPELPTAATNEPLPPALPAPAVAAPVSRGTASSSDAGAHAAQPGPHESAAADSTDVPAAAPAIADAASPAPAAVDDPYAHGLALERSGNFEEAARELGRAAEHDPTRGDLALYSLGRLEQQQLHDPARALATFRRYRDRYPRGALIPEVDFEVLKLEVEERESAAALSESTRFLGNHPGSERAEAVHLLRGNLLRDAGRCREALGDYASIRDVGLADDAIYSTAYCQRKLGDRTAAAATLNAYLQRFPAGAHRADAVRAIESGNETEK